MRVARDDLKADGEDVDCAVTNDDIALGDGLVVAAAAVAVLVAVVDAVVVVVVVVDVVDDEIAD